jgi:hypothetical protein
MDKNKKNSKDNSKKIRVNITLDAENLKKAKSKMDLFGGKLSTLFNLYLSDFVESMDKNISDTNKELSIKLKELELRLAKIEQKV